MRNNRIKDIVRELIIGKDSSPNVSNLFKEWLITSENNKESEKMLFEVWDELNTGDIDSRSRAILNKLHGKIKYRQLKHNLWGNIKRSVAVAASIAIVFCSGYILSSKFNVSPKEYHLATSKGSKGEFLLPDGSKVWLNSDSYLVYNSDFGDKDRGVELVKGEVFFDVVKDTLKPFIVDMDIMDIRVLGTKFNARNTASDGAKEVVLVEGRVEITGEDIDPVLLLPNERYTLELHTNISVVDTVVSHSYSTWFDKTLKFENETLFNVFTSLERWYNVEIEVSPEINLNSRLSLTTRYEPVEDIIRIISRIYNLEYAITGDNVKINTYKK